MESIITIAGVAVCTCLILALMWGLWDLYQIMDEYD